jgi:hypothetical protein
MKKSIVASIFAGLFAVSALAADDTRVMEIEVKKETGSPVVIDINNDGNTQVFEFTKAELEDTDLIENRLAGVDEKTREMVMNALKGIHTGHESMVWLDDEKMGDDMNKFFKIKIGDGSHQLKLHRDSGQSANIIQQLLESSELTQVQLDQIQQALDSKR